MLVTGGRDELYAARSAGAERAAAANVVMNELAATGVDPASVNADELAKLIEARGEIPREAFAEAMARERRRRASRPSATSPRPRSSTPPSSTR